MKRRINFTNRKKIQLNKHIQVTLKEDDDGKKLFDAVFYSDGLDLPDYAEIFLEAYYHMERIRFPMGTIKDTIPLEDKSLDQLAIIENIRFRVVVVDNKAEKGLILASVIGLSPISDKKKVEDKQGIMPISFMDLDTRIWKLEINKVEGPSLQVNKKLPNIKNIAKSEPRFIFYIFPAIVREVFQYILFISDQDDLENNDVSWINDWKKFAEIYSNKSISSISGLDEEEKMDWIQGVEEEFCNSMSSKWRELKKIFEGENQ